MNLVKFISNETGVDPKNIMLLRHSSTNIDKLIKYGGSIEEYTSVQPINSKWDFLHSEKIPIEIVVVIVHDKIYGVYSINGIETTGTTYNLTSSGHRNFDIKRGKPEKPAKRFILKPINSPCVGKPIKGWEGSRTRTSVQRYDGGFFNDIELDLEDYIPNKETIDDRLQYQVFKSLQDNHTTRLDRLSKSNKYPKRIETISINYERNPDVIAEVLLRANGKCELCGNCAPFNRKSDGTPYLEVHHKVRLADGGEDTVLNAIALCPNCHRKIHYG